MAKLDKAELILTISADGRILIPALLRESLEISSGSKILALLENGQLTLKPLEAKTETDQNK